MEHESDGDINCIGAHGTLHRRLVKGLEDLKIREQVEPIQTIALLRSKTVDLMKTTVTQIP